MSKSATAIAALVLSVLGACTDDTSDTDQGDTVAPMIAATANIAVDAGAIVLSATVSDNVAVTAVEFMIDANAKATVTDSAGRSTFSTSIPVDRISKGSHRMVARAIDAAGNATVADTVTFQIGQPSDNDSPITITATAVKDGASVTFTVDIESDAQISLTNFFMDGEFLGGRGDDQRHYVLTRTLATGTHRFVVDVSDVNGNSEYAEVEVVVSL